jgi:hypothetical protein
MTPGLLMIGVVALWLMRKVRSLFCFNRKRPSSLELTHSWLRKEQDEQARTAGLQCQEKFKILRLHLLEAVAVSDLCEAHGIKPTLHSFQGMTR